MKIRILSAFFLLISSFIFDVSAQGPTNYLTPTAPPSGQYFPVYSNANGLGTASGSWASYPPGTSSTSSYVISDVSCQQIILSPDNVETEAASAYFTLSNPKDVSSYNRIRFDVWFEDVLADGAVYIALRSPGSQAVWKTLRSPLPALGMDDIRKWKTVEVNIDEMDFFWESFPSDYILNALEQIHFNSPASNNFSKTFYVDNIYFYTYEVDNTTPIAPAYLPPAINNSGNVISSFSDSYSNPETPSDLTPSPEIIPIRENNIWKFENTDDVQLSFAPSGLDISGMTHAHLDLWTATATDITIQLNNSLPQNVTTTAGEWLRLDIPVSGLANISSVSISGLDNKACFVDNLYFYKDQTPFNVDISAYNKSLGKGVNFGDIFDYNQDNWNPDYMQMVADLGFTHVRLPVSWEGYQRSMTVPPYNIEPDFLNKIKEVVDLAIEKNLKIIVNMHHHNAVSADPSGQEPRFVSQWRQIADFFRYYPDNLIFEVFNEPNSNGPNFNITPAIWNHLLVKGLDAIRETNPTRPVLIGTSGGGGLSGLSDLELPADDNNLIVTVHYYNPSDFTHQGAEWANPAPPVGTEWLDTESDRVNVENDYQLIADFVARDNRPIHIGEFGVYEKADMDSRVRWTTYIARYTELKGYSWTYWDFDAKFGIYDPANQVYRQPLVNALLKNPMPPEPFEEKFTFITKLYDSNEDKTGNFSTYNCNRISGASDDDLILEITSPGSNIWDAQATMPFALTKGVSYRVSFTVRTDDANGAVYQNYFQNSPQGSTPTYVKYSNILTFTPTTVPTTYSYFFTMNENDDPTAKIYFDLGAGGTKNITFSDILIEEIDIRFEAAPIPVLVDNDVNNIYSSVYTNDKTLTYSNPGGQTTIEDNNNGEIILFSDFEEQIISLSENLTPGDKQVLHLEAYAGSPLDLKITFSGNINKEVTYPLESHEWTSLDIDLSDVLTSGKYINSIKLSGGTGNGRKLYLDHLYFYKKNESGGIPDDDNRNIWLGSVDDSWDDPANWSLNSVPDNNTIVYLHGDRVNYPVLKEPKKYICKEVYFLPGAQLGRSDLLTYEKVHIQINVGLEGSEQKKSTDINQHLKYAARYSAEPIARDRWYMLSAPLHTVLTGDLSFGGYPGTDIRKMDVAQSASGSVFRAGWSDYYTTLTQDFQPAEGFVFRVNGYRDEWPYMEYGIDNAYRRFGLEQVNGIIELPYYEDRSMSRAHRIHTYNAGTNVSTFSLLSSSGEITENTQTVDRGDKAYRFAFEDGANSPDVIYRAERTGQGNFVLIGNPYMSAIDFDKFYEDNKDLIKPLYQLWTGKTFSSYNAVTGDTSGEINENTGRYIAPMQSFVIQLKDQVTEGAELIFNIKNITPEKLTGNTLLRSDNTRAAGDAFTITAANSSGTVQTFITSQAGGSSVLSEMEGNKLIAEIGAAPDIYLLKPSAEGQSDVTGVPYMIVGDNRVEAPLAIATSLKGKTTFTFAGMNRSNAYITFMDIEAGYSRDITGMGSFDYEFDYNPPMDMDNSVIANEDRFRIRFVPKTVGTEQIEGMENILIYKNESSIHIMSTGDNLIRQVNLYDIQGRVLYKDAGINEMFYTVPPQGGTYPLMILEVITNNEVKRFKVR